jgi:ATP-dependent 26S proteasome regulatory subunit
VSIKVHAVIGVLDDDADPMVTVMKLEKAPQETYADIGGLDQQIQEIKVRTNFIRLLYQNSPISC